MYIYKVTVVDMHIYKLIHINVGSFLWKMCKFDHFLYYTHTGVIALVELIKVNI